MSTDKIYTVEPREEGGFAVKAEGGKKASAILPTQEKAIAKAEQLNPNAKPSVARVRHTPGGGPDKFRKI